MKVNLNTQIEHETMLALDEYCKAADVSRAIAVDTAIQQFLQGKEK